MAKPRKRQDGDTSVPDNSSTARSGGNSAPPGPDRISMRAYELYLARGGSDGQDMEDWLAAERELSQSGAGHSHGSSGE